MKKSAGVSLLLLGMVLSMVGCELFDNKNDGPLDYSQITDIRFSLHVQQLLDNKCTGCHAGQDAAAGLGFDSWAQLIAGSDFGEAVIPFDPEGSLLLEMVTKLAGGPHPLELQADTLRQDEVDFLRRWIAEGAQDDAGTVPYTNASNRVYVCSQNAALISVIDTRMNVVIRTIDLQVLGFSATAKPHHTAVEPDESFWYVSLIGENKVLKFSRDNDLVGQADFETPGMLALHPTQDLLFVGRSLSAVNPPSSLGMIRRSDMQIEEVEVTFPRPHALILHPAGDYIFSASLALDQLIALHIPTGDVSFTAFTGPQPHTIVQHAVSPDGQTMYSSGQLSGQMLVFDIRDPLAIVQTDAIAVNAAPWHPTFTPDGRFMYVGNKDANTVTVIDANTQTVADVISGNGLAEPHGIAASPDGRFVYVSNRNTQGAYTPRYDLGDNANIGTVVVIDVATNTVVKVLEVEAFAAGMSMASR